MIQIEHTKSPKGESVKVSYQGQVVFEGSTITPRDLWEILEKTNVPINLVEIEEFQ